MSKGFANNRLTFLSLGVVACFMAVGVRLVFLHVVDRDELLRFVDKARRQIVVEHARRGAILDARGNLLATSRSEMTVAVDAWSLDEYLQIEKNPAKRARKAAEEQAKRVRLASLLGLPTDEVEKAFVPAMRPIKPELDQRDGKVDGLTKDRWVKLREGITDQVFDKIAALNVRGLTAERVYRRVDPVARPALLPGERCLVVAAKADRVTPAGHARRLATHLRAPVQSFYGGHLLQLGRAEAFERIIELISTPRRR